MFTDYRGNIEWPLVFVASIFGPFVLFILFMILVYGPVNENTRINCNDWGYTNGMVNLNFDRYCVREVQETEYVIPFEEAENHWIAQDVE